MTQEIVWLTAQENDSLALVGGKAHGLLRLVQSGCLVPPGFVLTPHFFAAPSKPDLLQAAYEQLAEATGLKNPAVAIRSSALAEDGESHSFAGAFTTFLGIRGLPDVSKKVAACQKSLFSVRARRYRAVLRLAGFKTAVPQMAVIVQAMVPAQAAGVMMTLNPVNGDRSKIVIEATWGLGQPLVDGSLTPDRFLIDKVTGEVIEQTIVPKSKMLQLAGSSQPGTAVVPVPQHLTNAPSLTPAEIEALCHDGRRLERRFGAPQDIEFAVYEHQLYLLQARPETVWARKQAKVHGLDDRPIDHIVKTLLNMGKSRP